MTETVKSEATADGPGCNCVTEMDERLKQYNGRLITNLFGPQRAFLTLEKLDSAKRGKPPLLGAAYCPFCGVKYPTDEAAKAEGHAR